MKAFECHGDRIVKLPADEILYGDTSLRCSAASRPTVSRLQLQLLAALVIECELTGSEQAQESAVWERYTELWPGNSFVADSISVDAHVVAINLNLMVGRYLCRYKQYQHPLTITLYSLNDRGKEMANPEIPSEI